MRMPYANRKVNFRLVDGIWRALKPKVFLDFTCIETNNTNNSDMIRHCDPSYDLINLTSPETNCT